MTESKQTRTETRLVTARVCGPVPGPPARPGLLLPPSQTLKCLFMFCTRPTDFQPSEGRGHLLSPRLSPEALSQPSTGARRHRRRGPRLYRQEATIKEHFWTCRPQETEMKLEREDQLRHCQTERPDARWTGWLLVVPPATNRSPDLKQTSNFIPEPGSLSKPVSVAFQHPTTGDL